jgi:DNA-binding LacI/PurR family transcriptional regulator
LEAPLVGVNNEQGAYQATRYLIDLGHERFAFLMGLETISTQRDRLCGFKRALHEANLPLDEKLLVKADPRFYGTLANPFGFSIRPSPAPQTLPSAYQALQELLSLPNRPSAVFATTNQLAVGTLYAFREHGLECPRDISLISFDDHDWAPLFTPPLTVMRQPTYRLGRLAANLLMKLIKGETVESPPPLPAELIIRGSCQAPQTLGDS